MGAQYHRACLTRPHHPAYAAEKPAYAAEKPRLYTRPLWWYNKVLWYGRKPRPRYQNG